MSDKKFTKEELEFILANWNDLYDIFHYGSFLEVTLELTTLEVEMSNSQKCYVTSLKDIPQIGSARFTFDNYDGGAGFHFWNFVDECPRQGIGSSFEVVGWCHAIDLAVRPRTDSIAVMIHDFGDDDIFWFHVANY